ncbi:MFS transporter [Desulfobulbus sp. US2]|nr:MFS transporter [Desulfobulbus sp. US4]MCW5207882.1 MFS transporter [Desulfobulbus sp. US2]MCW5214389.1 MFS transporter [Desulfobulbus sp. US5]
MSEIFKIFVACAINMLAVSTVFMTQSIFFEISESFNIDITQARLSFSIVSLSYSASFFFLGPPADKFNLPKIAVSGLLLLAMTVMGASYATGFGMFITAMALMGICAALIPASMFPHVAKTSPENKLGVYVGLIVASGTLGVIFGRAAMGLLTATIGWQSSFRIVAVVLLFLAAISFFSLVEKDNEKAKTHQNLFKLYTNSIRLMFRPKILSLLLVGFSLYFGFLGMITFLTYRLLGPPFNFFSGEIGWISFAGITALIAPFSGNISKKTGVLKIIFSSLLLCLLSFQLMGWSQSITLITLSLLLIFLSVYSSQPLVFLLIGQSVPRESIGTASSLYILFCIGGGSLSSILLGPVWRSYGWHGVTVYCSLSLLISLLIMSVIALKKQGVTPFRKLFVQCGIISVHRRTFSDTQKHTKQFR